MKSSGYLAGISLLLTFTLTAGFLSLDSAPAGNGQASAQEERHGGDIIFEVKKNKQKLGHSIFSHQLHLDSGSTCKDCHNGRTVIKNKTIFHPKNNCKRCHSATFRKKRR